MDHVSPHDVGVFMGAGVSLDPPTCLPLAGDLKNRILKTCWEAVCEVWEQKPLEERFAKAEEDWALEYVISRVRGAVGHDALNVLETMYVSVPNVSHLLLALHLAHGGLQVTVNYDQGVEYAYDLLARRRELPENVPHVAASLLDEWRQLMPASPASIRVVANDAEFDAWVADGSPPALLKLHGAVRQGEDLSGGVVLDDPVAEDDPELQQLSTARLGALDALASRSHVLVTGYSGKDIDVYGPLMQRLRPASFTWGVKSLPRGKGGVRDDVDARSGRFLSGDDGLADVVLRRTLGLRSTPAWLTDPVPPNWEDTYGRWAARVGSDPMRLAAAYPWMLFDALRYGFAIDTLELIRQRTHGKDWNSTVRLADAYYHRNSNDDRQRARDLFAMTARSDARLPLRQYAVVRLGETFRSSGDLPVPVSLFVAWALPTAVVLHARAAANRSDEADPSMVGLAHSTLGHLYLRVLERVFGELVGRSLPVPRMFLRAAASRSIHHQVRAIESSGGNRGSFARQQLSEARALRELLSASPQPDRGELEELQRIFDGYEIMPDERGMANTRAAMALWHAVMSDLKRAHATLDDALARYRRPDTGEPDPSGSRLVKRRRRVLEWVARGRA